MKQVSRYFNGAVAIGGLFINARRLQDEWYDTDARVFYSIAIAGNLAHLLAAVS